jgi:hypothetical protein
LTSVDQRSSTVGAQYIADEQHITNIFYPAREGAVETIATRRPAGIDCPSLPHSFLRRPSLFHKAIAQLNNPGASFCVMVGESGCGKTSCAVDVYTDLKNSGAFACVWIDCRLMVYTDADLTINIPQGRRTLVVIDFLNSEDHPIIANGFFERYCHACSLLVITNSEPVVKKVLQLKGCADRKDEVIIRFDLFNRTEVHQFVHKSTGLELSDVHVDQFLRNTKGYPQFCQMI